MEKQCGGRIRQKEMMLDELTQPEWEDADDDFHVKNEMSGTSELRFPASPGTAN